MKKDKKKKKKMKWMIPKLVSIGDIMDLTRGSTPTCGGGSGGLN